MEQIATQLGVSVQTISNDLVNFPTAGKSKPAKTASNPKGAGRPKGSAAKQSRRDLVDFVTMTKPTRPRHFMSPRRVRRRAP
jgi:hypothetical protein